MITINLDDFSSDVHARRTLSDISLSVAKSRKIVVVTGAGISCSCGIPDFRSSDGLYALVKQQYPDVVLKGRDLFDASLFRDPSSRAVFYTFISQLKQSVDVVSPTPTHHFIKTLDTKKKLLRSYTQNIDGLEARAGLLCSSEGSAIKNKKLLKDVRNVQLHGDIHRVRCITCSAEYVCTEEHTRLFSQGTPPDCPECLSRYVARLARSARPIRIGTLRPAIVLYDEPHPYGDEIGVLQSADVARKPDLLIIMGTSLKVHGLKKLVKEFAKTVHASTSSTDKASKKSFKVLFINKTPPSSDWDDIIDCHIAGETDQWASRVIEDWRKLKPADWEVQQTLVSMNNVNDTESGFKVVKDVKAAVKVTKQGNKAGVENVPPMQHDNKDNPHSKAKKVPLSPSKRSQGVSHYSDIESSPSKRRPETTGQRTNIKLNPEERKPLFMVTANDTDATNLDLLEMECSLLDLSMRDVEPIVESKQVEDEAIKPLLLAAKSVKQAPIVPRRSQRTRG